MLAKKKAWLREQCGFILYQCIMTVQSEANNTPYTQAILDRLHSHKLFKTPEGIAIWIAADLRKDSVQFPKGVWHDDNPLDRQEVSKFATIMKESFQQQEIGKGEGLVPDIAVSQKGSWNANLNFAWSVIIEAVRLNTINDRSKGVATCNVLFQEFWSECVDSKLTEPEVVACTE